MPSRPRPFDDDEFRLDEPDHQDSAPRGNEPDLASATRRAESTVDEPARRAARHPNYLFRRGVVVGGVIAVVAAAAFVVVNVRETASDDAVSGSISAEWDRVVVVDPRTGRLVVDNDQGEELERAESDIRPVTATGVVGPTSLIVGSAGAASIDITDGTSTPIEIDARSIEVTSGSALTMIAPSQDGARGVLVNGTDLLDTNEFATTAGARYEFPTARSDPSGRDVLVTDSGNFQSVLFSFDSDEPSYFPGLALAIDDDLVVTAQNVGADATVSIFDHAGEPAVSGRTPSVRAALIAGDSIQIITVDGEIVTMSTDSGNTETSDQLDIGTIQSGHVAVTGEQLIVTGSTGTALVGTDGAVIASFGDRFPIDGTASTRGSTCVALIDQATDELVIAELATGSIRAEAVSVGPFSSTADGCTIAAPTAEGFQLIDTSAVSAITTDGELVALSPDGAFVVLDLDNRLVLAPVDDVADPIDLGPSGRSVAFTNS